MNKIRTGKPLDEFAYDVLVAEEELILHAQMLIQRILNERNISQKKLAEKMGVGESYVSQMLGLSARNLTLRTIARVMKALDAKATLVLDECVDDLATMADVVNNDAKAVASRMAAAGFSQVWGEVIALPPRRKARRSHEADAESYASYDPSVREMETALAA